jgi:hypothetical protein
LNKAVLFGTVLLAAQSSFGSLVLQSPVQQSGSGLGTEPTLLTIHNNTTVEAGCAGFSTTGTSFGAFPGATAGVCQGSASDVLTGAGQIGPQTLLSAGVTSASNFGIVFNAAQTSGGPITLTGLTVAFYSPTGTLLYQTNGLSCAAALGTAACNLTATQQGTGLAGYVFVLDTAQANAATSAGAFSSQNNRVGISGSVSNANGGNETFYLATATPTAPGPQPTPEPSTWIMSIAGLILVCIGSRLKLSAQK